MAWLRVELTEGEQRIVQDERESHPDACVRRRLWALWLLHCGTKREQAAKILGVACSTVQRDVSAYRTGGLEALRKSGREYQPTSELAKHQDQIRQSLERQPARTIAEACQRIAALTGVERKPTQVSRFLKGLGLKWQRVRAIPVPPKKTSPSTPPIKPLFSTKH
jgi:transposase